MFNLLYSWLYVTGHSFRHAAEYAYPQMCDSTPKMVTALLKPNARKLPVKKNKERQERKTDHGNLYTGGLIYYRVVKTFANLHWRTQDVWGTGAKVVKRAPAIFCGEQNVTTYIVRWSKTLFTPDPMTWQKCWISHSLSVGPFMVQQLWPSTHLLLT